MSLLYITFPAGPPGSYAWATSPDGQAIGAHGHAAPGLLPPAGRGVETVAVLPAAQLSWHRVTLPKGVGPNSPRLRAILAGLLEDRLLQEPDELHFALEPSASAGQPAWVAVCGRHWLASHVQALEAAQRPVDRIVPELAPAAGPLRLHAVGDAERPQLLLAGDAIAGGVQALPLLPATVPLLPPMPAPEDAAGAEIDVFAEPAVAAQAEQLLQRRVTLQPPAERALLAGRAAWDLAQGEFAQGSRARTGKRLGAWWRDFLHAPAWRPARWGALLLLLAQIVGINTWAWRERADLQAQRERTRSVLTETFPNVKVVVDAPLQMAREVATLRQASGAASPRDLEPMLTALGTVLTAPATASALEYGSGELRLRGQPLGATELGALNERLTPAGYRLRTDADALVLAPEAAR